MGWEHRISQVLKINFLRLFLTDQLGGRSTQFFFWEAVLFVAAPRAASR